MAESNYKVAGSLNFKRMKKGVNISTTIETKSSSANKLLEQVRKCKGIEGFINHRLYHLHASSQNYYYVKDVNQIVSDERTASSIKFKDILQEMGKEELMKRYYKYKEYHPKMVKLCEYYKFHKEIPRMFAKDSYDTFFDHHDKKRKVEYVVITKKLREEAGEDVRSELEQNLKKLRDTKYEPLLQDLFIPNQFKSSKINIRQKTQPNESCGSLQDQLSRIFKVTDSSYSELHMMSMSKDDSQYFTKNLPEELKHSNISMKIARASSISPPKDKLQVQAAPSKQITLKQPQLIKQGKPETISAVQSKLTISPDVIESLKKISLPGTTSKPGSHGASKIRSSFSREVDIVDAKVGSAKLLPPGVVLSGAVTLQASSANVKKGIKALTREQSLKDVNRNKHSAGSVKRGLTFNKRNTEDEVKIVSLKRENSDFRITKKNSIDQEGSQRKIGEVYSSTEKKSGVYGTKGLPQSSLVNLNLASEKGQAQINSVGSKYKNNLKAFPSAPKLQSQEGSSASTKVNELVRNSSTKNLQSFGKTGSSPVPTLSSISNVQNFKVDIDRLLKASGIMDYGGKQDSGQNPMTITNRGSMAGPAGYQATSSKHKHTRSGPESLVNANIRQNGQSRTFRSNHGSIDATSNNMLRQTNSISGLKPSGTTVKNTAINFYVSDHQPSEKSQAFRINQPSPAPITMRESTFHKKGSFSMTQNKPYLVESNLMEQRGVKLVKKTGTTRAASKKF